MAEVPHTVTVQVDIESGDLIGVIEQLVAESFSAGHAHAARQADQTPENRMTVEQAYEDWRGWGPGARLPGGSAFREAVELHERVAEGLKRKVWLDDKTYEIHDDDDLPTVCIRHRTFVPCRHGRDGDPCLETTDPRAVALTQHYQRATMVSGVDELPSLPQRRPE
jgi:hypothetical protein